jgi:FlaA1/EpsC-like NDP-sugar epimerase
MAIKGLMGLLAPTQFKRSLFFVTVDVVSITVSLFLSFLVHFELNPNIAYIPVTLEVLPYFIVVKLVVFFLFKLNRMTWRYVGINDLTGIVMALVFSQLVLVALSLPNSVLPELAITGFPKRVIFIDGVISLCLIGGLRLSKRVYLEVLHKKGPAGKGKATIILGAGDTGEMILRDMMRNSFRRFYPVGFLDDNTIKKGTRIHGVRVLGTIDDLKETIPKYVIEAVVIAIPSLNHQKLRAIFDAARMLKVGTIKIVPRIYDFTRPDINLKALEDISVEDLIGRQSIAVDQRIIRDFLAGKSVLITGAGGSIGSEIVSQVGAFDPKKMVLFDIDETELHNLSLRLDRLHPELADKVALVVGDVRDAVRVREVFGKFMPEIVFHAAAYKHVPMMEWNPKEAVKVNIFGTLALVEASIAAGVEKFIMISTDKAVRPTSVMGATKRIAEFICKAHDTSSTDGVLADCGAQGQGTTRFISVRFGNVLGSRGSVLPVFLEQLRHGGPITVTHKDMKRYFMTIPEAVSLVLQASTMGNGGEVFVLDMGEPVRIVELAEELIRIHGLEPYKDIDITFAGLRPGEKLFEEILTAEEGTDASKHEKVFIARNSTQHSRDDIRAILADFEDILRAPSPDNGDEIGRLLRKYVVHFAK